MAFVIIVLVSVGVIVWLISARKPSRKPKATARNRHPEKTPAEMAAEVQTRADFNRLLRKLERETEKVASFASDAANDRRVDRVERIQQAIDSVERTHEWANYGEGYRPELEPPKRGSRPPPRARP